MRTHHHIYFQNASQMRELETESVDLVVTSPPYPMIQMWDELFANQNPAIKVALDKNQGQAAFELMHQELDQVWEEVGRVLKPGGLACVNIGDATRTIEGNFALYLSHVRIADYFLKHGFWALPEILWRKQTNAPNKFMGSGMLPPGAYVTLEHEFILIFRKGRKRELQTVAAKKNRHESAFFWEERNVWFSDVWMDLKGTTQNLFDEKVRRRSAAFPFEVAYRLINMFSVKGDVVLDPFSGLGTMLLAAMTAGRNSVSYELDANFKALIESQVAVLVPFARARIEERLSNHLEFVKQKLENNVELKYKNRYYQFPVMTSQEQLLLLNSPLAVQAVGENVFEVEYSDSPQEKFCMKPGVENLKSELRDGLKRSSIKGAKTEGGQLSLLNSN